nr:MAG TPA: hypothetical protein [Caudoviricetes sp.]
MCDSSGAMLYRGRLIYKESVSIIKVARRRRR